MDETFKFGGKSEEELRNKFDEILSEMTQRELAYYLGKIGQAAEGNADITVEGTADSCMRLGIELRDFEGR